MNKALHRRTVLKAAGVSLALPLLESMNPAMGAVNNASPKRMVFICTTLGLHPPLLWPKNHGADYESTPYLDLLREHPKFWCKVSCPDRLSQSGPHGYDDVVPFARRVVEEFPDRVLWGTDWPHPNLKSHMPDDGKLVDFIPRIAATRAARRRTS